MGRLVAIALLLAGCGGAAVQAETTASGAPTYEIRLSRNPPVGASWTEGVHLEDRREVVASGPDGAALPAQVETRVVDMTGVYTVTAVDDHDRASALRLVIHALEWDVGQGAYTSTALPLVLVLDRRDGGSVRDDAGQPIEPAMLHLLESVIPSTRRIGGSDDVLVGSDERRAVGESWPIHADQVAQMLGAVGHGLTPDTVRGDTTLVAVRSTPVGDALQLRTVMSTHGLHGGTGSTAAVRSMDMLIRIDSLYPIDPTRLATEEDVQMSADADIVASTPAGERTGHMAMTQTIRRVRSQ